MFIVNHEALLFDPIGVVPCVYTIYYKHIIPLGLGFCHANLTPHSSSHTTIIFCATFVHFAVNHPTVAEQILRYTQNDKELITSHTCFKERPLRPLMSFTLNYSLFTAHSSPLTPYSLLLTPYSLLLTPYSLLLTPYPLLLTPYSSPLTPHPLPFTPHSLLIPIHLFIIL